MKRVTARVRRIRELMAVSIVLMALSLISLQMAPMVPYLVSAALGLVAGFYVGWLGHGQRNPRKLDRLDLLYVILWWVPLPILGMAFSNVAVMGAYVLNYFAGLGFGVSAYLVREHSETSARRTQDGTDPERAQ